MADVEYLDEMARRHQQLPRPRLCYLEIPAIDAHQSATFYEKVFGWDIRHRDTPRPSFAYPSADVTGAWVTGRAVSREPGLLPYIWVDDIDDSLARIAAHGGSVVEPPHRDSPGGEWIATFRDPAGNLIGLYQEEPRA
jgi:predicted enzyme related to lactoylglutathione lyase